MKGRTEKKNEGKKIEKKLYEPPKVLVTYEKEELEEVIKLHAGGGGCGCGCGCAG